MLCARKKLWLHSEDCHPKNSVCEFFGWIENCQECFLHSYTHILICSVHPYMHATQIYYIPQHFICINWHNFSQWKYASKIICNIVNIFQCQTKRNKIKRIKIEGLKRIFHRIATWACLCSCRRTRKKLNEIQTIFDNNHSLPRKIFSPKQNKLCMSRLWKRQSGIYMQTKISLISTIKLFILNKYMYEICQKNCVVYWKMYVHYYIFWEES